MQQATGRRERKNARMVALICVALLLLTFGIAELKPWSRKPADAGECPTNGADWRQTALRNKIDSTNAPLLKAKSFDVQAGSHWDAENHLWVVPFRTAGQSADSNNLVALIHCTGSVDIKGGDS